MNNPLFSTNSAFFSKSLDTCLYIHNNYFECRSFIDGQNKVLPSHECLTVLTDSGGSIPFYFAKKNKRWALGTNLQQVAYLTNCTKLDLVSALDFMLHETVVYPYTWYKDVSVLPPGSRITIRPDGTLGVETLWLPTEPDYSENYNVDLDYWANRLKETLHSVIIKKTENAEKVRVLFSAGEDSRAVLGLIPKDLSPIPTMISDSRNREFRIAADVAAHMGFELDWVKRPSGYYKKHIDEKIRMVGPGRDIRHVHFNFEVGDKLKDAEVILGGYLADSLFKSNYISNIKRNTFLPDQITGPKPDVIKILDSCKGYDFFNKDLVEQVKQRRIDHHNRLKEIRPNTAGNWHSLWPLTNRNTFPQYLGARELGPRIIEPFMMHETYKLAAEMPDVCRINRAVFYKAFGKSMGRTGWKMTSSGTIPRLGHGYSNALLSGFSARARAVKDRLSKTRGEEMAWSPDHKGWEPILPADGVSKAEAERIFDGLKKITADKSTSGFLENKKVPLKVRMRALQLSFGEK